ncbi:MAG: c-type cytochrome domain-containing protein, partial [Verrucomicrobiota bacterium]
MLFLRLRVYSVLATTGLALAFTTGVSAAEPVDFGRDILPILSNNCYHCHGPDENQRKARLRLDTRDGALSAGKSGAAAVIPGKSAESELVLRITSTFADEVMPPHDAKEKLSATQIDLLKRWVDEGAKWGNHWAYQVPKAPAVPKVTDAKGVLSPIDAFVRARLEREKLAPSPEADRRTLARRLNFD